MKRIAWALLPIAIVAAVPAAAQQPSPVTVGAMIYDFDGGEVGTVQSVSGDAAVVSTGSARVTLGLRSFRLSQGRLVISMTRTQLEAAAQGAQARGDEEVRVQITPGAIIYDRNGAQAATVESVDGGRVTISAGAIRAVFPLSAFTAGPRGPQINRTAEEFQAALRERLPAQPPAPVQE